MLLQNEKAPNMKFAIGKEVISTDAEGKIEVDDKQVVEALLLSGFVLKSKKAKEPKKEEPKKEEPKEEPKAEESEESKEEEKPRGRVFRRNS